MHPPPNKTYQFNAFYTFILRTVVKHPSKQSFYTCRKGCLSLTSDTELMNILFLSVRLFWNFFSLSKPELLNNSHQNTHCSGTTLAINLPTHLFLGRFLVYIWRNLFYLSTLYIFATCQFWPLLHSKPHVACHSYDFEFSILSPSSLFASLESFDSFWLIIIWFIY